MKYIKIILLAIFVFLLNFVAYTLVSTGFFRTVQPHFEGKIVKKVPLKGAEDITTSLIDSFAIISATNRFGYPRTKEEHGALYYMELKSGSFQLKNLTPKLPFAFAPHGISIFKKDSTYTVAAINHTEAGHSIEVFTLIGDQLQHLKTCQSEAMISPNDVVLVDEQRFYFTNDHAYTEGIGLLAEEYLGLTACNVVYFDGKSYKEVANDIAYANGINIDVKRQLLFVSSVRDFIVKTYHIEQADKLQFIEDIPCGFGVDNIELDEAGQLWIGGHPSLLGFSSYSKGKKAIAPSEIIKLNYIKQGEYELESIYVEDGEVMSGASVASPFGNLIFAGNVMDEEFLILELEK